jgi:transketolase
LQAVASEARRQIVQAVHDAGAGHIGGPFSAVDMLVALYFEILRVDPEAPDWPDRDRFVLSKGHSAIGLYAVLALRGYFGLDELKTFDHLGSRLQGHPDMSVLNALDMSTGSLGQGISPAVGMAIGARLQDKAFRTWVMLGDGECQEGQVWEAALVAARFKLDNLTVIIDANGLQQYGSAGPNGYESATRLDPFPGLASAWRGMGWHVLSVDGHSLPAFVAACRRAEQWQKGPSVIVARTVKGKGVSFMEGDFSWHARVPTDDELERALSELVVTNAGDLRTRSKR